MLKFKPRGQGYPDERKLVQTLCWSLQSVYHMLQWGLWLTFELCTTKSAQQTKKAGHHRRFPSGPTVGSTHCFYKKQLASSVCLLFNWFIIGESNINISAHSNDSMILKQVLYRTSYTANSRDDDDTLPIEAFKPTHIMHFQKLLAITASQYSSWFKCGSTFKIIVF